MGIRKGVSAGQGTGVGPAPSTAPVYDSYARLSKNPTTGEFEKIETQWADNQTVIDRLGGTLGKELDDGLSAWKRNVRRPGWEKAVGLRPEQAVPRAVGHVCPTCGGVVLTTPGEAETLDGPGERPR